VVLVFAGNDPTGGAGIQADIEPRQPRLSSGAGGHALTVQDTVA